MIPRLGTGFASSGESLPMLLECDRRGQVIWLSERTRSAIGTPRTIAEILERQGTPATRFRLLPILQAPDGLLLALEVDDFPSRALRQPPCPLRLLELKMLYAYFRLLGLERRLAVRSARRRKGGGRLALRQIEVERQRLASELHTGVGQMLAAIRLQSEVVTSQVSDPPASVRQALENISALAAEALNQVRSVSRRLHPPEWQRLTIEAALGQLWTLSGIPLTYQAQLDLEDLGREPDPEVKALIYRTAQEGLSNIIGHTQAVRVSLSLRRDGALVELVLQDDGQGFEPTTLERGAASLASGIGLRALKEQARAVGAKFDIASGRNGTKLVLLTQFSANSDG
ncbi:MAG TPA: histidine kinase [Bryobacteraceae bacterium]|nr:histidine kinase [Bryobacteraceae bacterium]